MLFFAYQCFLHWFSWVFFGFSVVFMFLFLCFYLFFNGFFSFALLFYRPFRFLRLIFGFQYVFLTLAGLSLAFINVSLILMLFLLAFHLVLSRFLNSFIGRNSYFSHCLFVGPYLVVHSFFCGFQCFSSFVLFLLDFN